MANQGDERTPDKTISEIKYADGQSGTESEARRVVEGSDEDRQSQTQQKQGGAGEPETSKLEPEKSGGIGGP
jgi:hypothetical protein